MRKYANECNTSNPLSLRATQLRKHIATKSALINLDKENVHCLQNFLGHEEKIHNQIYRQPLEHREIVNVSKLLQLGGGVRSNEHDAQVSDIDNTNVELTTTSLLEDNNESSHLQNESSISSATSDDLSSPSKKRRRLLDIEPGHIKRRTWSTPQKNAARTIFGQYIDSHNMPSTTDCVRLIEGNDSLKQRTTRQIRLWINHQIKKKTQTDRPIRRSWKTPERETLNQAFHDYIQPNSDQYPSIQEIQEVKNKFRELQNRTPRKIKSQIQHLRKEAKKRTSL